MKSKYLIALALTIIIFAILILMQFKHEIFSRYLSLKFSAGKYQVDSISTELNYRLYTPASVKKKPLLLILHSKAKRGQDNFRQLDRVAYHFSRSSMQKKNPMYILVPQVPDDNDWITWNDDKYHPCRHYKPCRHYNQDNTKEKEEITLTISLIRELAQKYPIDTNRLYIMGFSMGATGVWDVITRYPDVFAAAAPMAGSSDISRAHVLNNIAIWAFTGENDWPYGSALNENMINKINEYGGHAKHTIFPGVGHNCKQNALKLMEENNWPFNILKE